MPDLRRIGAHAKLWELSITSRLRAFVRTESDQAEVIALRGAERQPATAAGSISDGSLFLGSPTRLSTGQMTISSAA
jgi:hypothetical protein